jgi:hypothetical protein
MGQAAPTQHPAVVLRSHFNHLRALLAVALIAVIGLTVAVVILASDENRPGDSNAATPIGHVNYGGFNPATGRPESAPLPQREHPLRSRLESVSQPQRELRMYGFTAEQAAREVLPCTRYDGGPEEGINAAAVVPPSPTTRYDGGPDEGTGGAVKDYSKERGGRLSLRAAAQIRGSDRRSADGALRRRSRGRQQGPGPVALTPRGRERAPSKGPVRCARPATEQVPLCEAGRPRLLPCGDKQASPPVRGWLSQCL